MKTFEFTIVASGLDHDSDEFIDHLFEAGCDDATIAVARGVIIIQFAREAESLDDAISTAIANVRSTGATVDRIEPDYLVSLSEIAERAHLTKAAVSLYTKGERGKDFPRPVARVTTSSPLWDWPEVADWLFERKQIPEEVVSEAHTIWETNLHLEEDNEKIRLSA